MKKQSWKKDFASFILDDSMEKQAVALKIRHFPGQLFRFGRFDERGFWKAPLLKHQIWLSSPRFFNDPFDCELIMDNTIIEAPTLRKVIYQVLQKNLADGHIIHEMEEFRCTEDLLDCLINCAVDSSTQMLSNDEKRLALEHLVNGVIDAFRAASVAGLKVVCFSEKYDLTIMWGHYADNHRGFCISYDFMADTRKRIKGKGIALYPNIWPVIYQQQRVDFGELFKQGKIQSVTNAALFKSHEWKYEKEWRLMWSDSFNEHGAYVKDGGCMRAIYFGARADLSSKNIIRVIKHAENIGVPVFYMKLSDNEYKLTAVPLK